MEVDVDFQLVELDSTAGLMALKDMSKDLLQR
jgi:hypothetical protein